MNVLATNCTWCLTGVTPNRLLKAKEEGGCWLGGLSFACRWRRRGEPHWHLERPDHHPAAPVSPAVPAPAAPASQWRLSAHRHQPANAVAQPSKKSFLCWQVQAAFFFSKHLKVKKESCLLSRVQDFLFKSRWPSWAFRPNERYGFCGRKATSNHA